jgi:riboflavin kinase/FMN adenylyltransferase
MRVIQGIRSNLLPASVVTLGMFDGVHRGHQALLQACREHADRLGVPAVALTYEPHPSVVLRPDNPVKLLTPLPEKLERLAAYRMDYVIIAEFTRDFSQLAPMRFLRDVLQSALHPAMVVAGYRTTFGHDRAGSAAILQGGGHELGFGVEIVSPVQLQGGPVSSSRIRAELAQGAVADVIPLLGYPYRLTGVVSRGDGRGHLLGIPTANLECAPEKLIPADGVYAVVASAPGVVRPAVMSIGARSTFGRPFALEIHLLDYHADLYGQPLVVTMHRRLRDMLTCRSSAELLACIHDDIARTRGMADDLLAADL